MYSPPVLRPAACEICQDLPKGYSPKDFKDAHGFSKDWQLQGESEEERYGTAETHNEHLRKEYLEMAARNRLCLRPEFQAVMSRREKEPILRNLARINRYEQFQKVANTQQRGRSIDDGTDSSHTTMPVKMCANIFEETSVIIQVCEARFVRGGRWYLGHPPGTYIFKYRGSQTIGSGLNTFVGAPGYIMPENFEFMGQVPRLENVHKLRLNQLFQGVFRLFISELQVCAGLQHRDLYPELEELLRLERVVESAVQFGGVWEHWRNAYVKHMRWPNAEIRKNFVSHPKIQELAWLLNFFKCLYSGIGQEPEPLEKLLTLATGKQLHEISSLWEERERETAWKMLKSGNRRGLFVYEVAPETEHIHNFYRQPPFNNDPLNPAVLNSYRPLELIPVSAQELKATFLDGVNRLIA